MSEPTVVAPKDVLARIPMPSWWGRRVGIRGKDADERHYLAFVAARFRGDPQVPEVDASVARAAHAYACGIVVRQIGGFLVLVALVVLVVADAAAAGCVFAIALPIAIVGNILAIGNAGAAKRHSREREQAEAARVRLHPEVLHPDDAATVRTLQSSDEGKLAYGTALIAAEIARDPDWREHETLPVDLHIEVGDVAARARRLIEDREVPREYEQRRLHRASDVQALLAEERRAHEQAVGALAARVAAFADYRDKILHERLTATSESAARRRAVDSAHDEQARRRMQL
jgi:hypothetical protein